MRTSKLTLITWLLHDSVALWSTTQQPHERLTSMRDAKVSTSCASMRPWDNRLQSATWTWIPLTVITSVRLQYNIASQMACNHVNIVIHTPNSTRPAVVQVLLLLYTVWLHSTGLWRVDPAVWLQAHVELGCVFWSNCWPLHWSRPLNRR